MKERIPDNWPDTGYHTENRTLVVWLAEYLAIGHSSLVKERIPDDLPDTGYHAEYRTLVIWSAEYLASEYPSLVLHRIQNNWPDRAEFLTLVFWLAGYPVQP